MTLKHLLTKTSIGGDGKSIVLQDATEGYGLEENPFRSDLAWLTSATLHDGHGPAAVPGLSYLLNTGTPEAPVYEPATPLTGTHLAVPMEAAGRYEIKSVLVHRRSALKPEDGALALNLLYVDEETMELQRVTAAMPETGEDGLALGTYAYTFETLQGIEDALLEGYPSLLFPILQLLPFRQALALGNLSYLTEGGGQQCGTGPKTLRKLCGNRPQAYYDQRELCQDLDYQLMGAEANFGCNLTENLYANLREASHLAATLTEN